MRVFFIIYLVLCAALAANAQRDTVIRFDGINDHCRFEGDSLSAFFSVDLYFKDCALDTAPRTVVSLDGFELAIVGDSAQAAIEITDFSVKRPRIPLSNYAHGQWNHLGIEYNSSNNQVLILLNGFSVGSSTKNQFNWNGLLLLGSNKSRNSHFQGQIDNVRISDTLRLGFIATIPHRPFRYDSITVALWNFDRSTETLSLSAMGDSMILEAGAKPLFVYSDIIAQACEGELLRFSFPKSGSGFFATPASNFQWNDPDLQWSAVAGVRSYKLNFSDSSACLNSFLLQTEIFSLPETALGSDTNLCAGDSLLLIGSPYGNHLWSDASTADTFLVTAPGKYWLEVIDSNSCRSSDTIVFSGFPAPHIELGNDTTLPRFGTLELDAGPGFISYFWSTFESGQKILATLPSWYWVEVVDSNGCRGRDSIYILIEGIFPFGMEENQDADYFSVYPNPAKNELHIEKKSSYSYASWLIIGLNGQVLDFDDSSDSRIDISAIAPGTYMLWLRRDDGKLLSYNFVKASP